MDTFPRCDGRYHPKRAVCRACYAARRCALETTAGDDAAPAPPLVRDPVAGRLRCEGFHLAYTLASGQVFRWGRDTDGWWKGIAWGTAFHLRQKGDRVLFRASAGEVRARNGPTPVAEFLRWYLRLDEAPEIRIRRSDRYLRQARDRLAGFRFVRQAPFECTMSYILSVQAHMTLTKRRINFLAHTLGREIRFLGERYWTFPEPCVLADLNGRYFRHHRFGWRSERVATSARTIADALWVRSGGDATQVAMETWREIVDGLRGLSGSGVGLKVGKCIDLFALEQLGAVPVDTWVRQLAEAWYGVTGSDTKICAWAEKRWGPCAGYANEYLFAYYRELNGPSIYDRVISFCGSDLPSPELPFEAI